MSVVGAGDKGHVQSQMMLSSCPQEGKILSSWFSCVSLHLATLPEESRDFITEQDRDRKRQLKLAHFLRERPLVPLAPQTTDTVFDELDTGVMLPFCHCPSRGCTWSCNRISDYINGAGHEELLRVHELDKHIDKFQEALGLDVPRKHYVDYLEEAVQLHACGLVGTSQHMPDVGLSHFSGLLSWYILLT